MAESQKRDKILIIEDDPDVSEVVQICLEKEGYETCAAADGQAGLREFYSQRPDMVVLDIMLPKLDGWEVCRRIRELSDVPIIVLSGQGALADRVKGLGWLSAVTSLGAVAGQALGSALSDMWGPTAPGLASAALCMLVSAFARISPR